MNTTPPYLALIKLMLVDHQRQSPHHAETCAICKEAKAVLEAA